MAVRARCNTIPLGTVRIGLARRSRSALSSEMLGIMDIGMVGLEFWKSSLISADSLAERRSAPATVHETPRLFLQTQFGKRDRGGKPSGKNVKFTLSLHCYEQCSQMLESRHDKTFPGNEIRDGLCFIR